MIQKMLTAISPLHATTRPGRAEPRAKKHRPNPQRFLMEPRPQPLERVLPVG